MVKNNEKWDGGLRHLPVFGWAMLFSCPVLGRIAIFWTFYVFGSCFRMLAVMLVSDFFFFTVANNSSVSPALLFFFTVAYSISTCLCHFCVFLDSSTPVYLPRVSYFHHSSIQNLVSLPCISVFHHSSIQDECLSFVFNFFYIIVAYNISICSTLLSVFFFFTVTYSTSVSPTLVCLVSQYTSLPSFSP